MKKLDGTCCGVCCRGIWLRRNAWLFENQKMERWEVIEKAVKLVHEYKIAMEEMSPVQSTTSGGSRIWHAPESGVFKINSNATIFGDGKLDLGWIVRDELGEVMLATCAMHGAGCEVNIAEALAARHAVKTTVEAGLRNLVLESDCLKLI